MTSRHKGSGKTGARGGGLFVSGVDDLGSNKEHLAGFGRQRLPRTDGEKPKFRWRDYRTAAGARPVKAFFNSLSDDEAATVVAAMKEIARHGLAWARHLRGEIYEVRAESDRRAFRVLFAHEAKFILLSLSGFAKRSRKTPTSEIDLAMARLKDWRSRGK